MPSSVHILRTLRHTCHRCGGICQGKVVHLHADEATRMEGFALALGVERPVAEGRLRQERGRCVFLDEANLCRVHARWGAEAKPRVCQQAPVVAIRAEDGLRVGVDPGCLTSWRSWRDGPEVEAGALVATHVPLDPRLLPLEAAVVDLLDGDSITGVISALAGAPSADLPEGFAARLCERLRSLDLAGKLSHEDTAPALRSALAHVAAILPALQPGPAPVLAPEAEAFALHTARSLVWLRLVDGLPHPVAVAVLVLSGALACGWADPSIERFGPALSAWSRLVRAPANLAALLPSAGSLETLLRG